MWSGKNDKKSLDDQTRSCMSRSTDENWKSRSESRKREKKREKSKLNNARRLKGIYFIDPEDQDNKETLKSARRNLEKPMTAVMLCKRKVPNDMTKVFAQSETASEKTPKTIHGCEVRSHECT